MTRQHAASAYSGLKIGWKRLVQALGGVEATAAATRVGRNAVSDYWLAHAETRFVPVDVLLDAETLAGDPIVTRALAHAQGYELVPVVARDGSELASLLARIGRDTSDVFTQAIRVLAGGAITEAERAQMLTDLEDMRDAARLTIAHLTREATVRRKGQA